MLRFLGLMGLLLCVSQPATAQTVKQNTFTECSKGKFWSNGRHSFERKTCLPASDESCAEYAVDFSAPHNLNFIDDNATSTGWGVETGLDTNDRLEGLCVISSGVLTDDGGLFSRRKACRTFTQKVIGKCLRKPSPLLEGEVYQHSAKLLCGMEKIELGGGPAPRTGLGVYNTVVNFHNPTYQPLRYRWKIVSAGRQVDGTRIVGFEHSEIGPDAAQHIDCSSLKDFPLDQFFDGYVVVESEQPLDVDAVHTLNRVDTAQPVSIDVERAPERVSNPGKDWYCHSRNRIALDALDPSGSEALLWKKPDGSPIYRASNLNQFSHTPSITGAAPGDYDFDLNLCLCGSGDQAGASINWNTYASDDGSTAVMILPNGNTSSPLFSVATANTPISPPNTTFTSVGTNTLRIRVNQLDFGPPDPNSNGMHITPKGFLSYQNGYLGKCR